MYNIKKIYRYTLTASTNSVLLDVEEIREDIMSISLRTLLAASVAVIAAGPAFADNADGQISGDITFYTHFANFVDNGR